MTTKILVPLDGSELGERALPVAISLATAMHGSLVLVRAVQPEGRRDGAQAEAEQKALTDARAYLASIVERLAQQSIVAEAVAPLAAAADGIVSEIGAQQAQMVVMCTHGRSGLGRWIYGSVAGAVLARSTVPVLLVRPSGPLAGPKLQGPGTTILVPLDGSAFGEAVLPAALQLAQALHGKLALMRVVVPSPGYYPDALYGQPLMGDVIERVLESEEEAARTYLAELSKRLGTDVLARQTVTVGFPPEVILTEAKDANAALIAMSTHGRTGLGELLLGSVALDVVRRSGLPLLLVRPSGLAQPAKTTGATGT